MNASSRAGRERTAPSVTDWLTSRLAKPKAAGRSVLTSCLKGSVLPSGGVSRSVLTNPLEDGGDAHTPTDTEGHETVATARAGELVQDLDRKDRACGPDRVSERDRAAEGVELLLRHPELATDGDRYGGEGFVRLDHVQVVHRESGLLDGGLGGGDHAGPHHRGIDAGDGGGDEPTGHGEIELPGLLLAGHEHHRRAVVDAAGVARGHRAAVLLEYRLELAEALDARVLADVLVPGELYLLLLLLHLDGDDLILEVALLDRLDGPLVAAHGVGVGVLAAYAVLLGDVLRRHAHVVVVEDVPQAVVDHVVVDVRIGHPHTIAVAALGQQERCLVHVLDAAGHHHVGVAQSYLLRRGDYGLQSRAAHAVEGYAGDFDRQPALYHALAGRKDVADDDLIHLLALYPRAGENLFADRGPQVRRRGVLERAAEGADRRSQRGRDDYLGAVAVVAEAHGCSFLYASL